MRRVFLFCPQAHCCLFIVRVSVSSVFAAGGQQSPCQNCFSCGARVLFLSIKTEPHVLSHNYVSLLHPPMLLPHWDPGSTLTQHLFPNILKILSMLKLSILYFLSILWKHLAVVVWPFIVAPRTMSVTHLLTALGDWLIHFAVCLTEYEGQPWQHAELNGRNLTLTLSVRTVCVSFVSGVWSSFPNSWLRTSNLSNLMHDLSATAGLLSKEYVLQMNETSLFTLFELAIQKVMQITLNYSQCLGVAPYWEIGEGRV